ncbi:hypothetical protein L2009_01285 [Lactobacillus gasseri]|uniref:hypothetical protein n=1 Tax=Lactobacillus gasseri TaxID=1596 RepID=UPI0022CDD9B9|nr:hypothetical protein [Lactobacillus gasseri]MCZ9726850.1 hypothetical protein [Lactobacillus gasseri]
MDKYKFFKAIYDKNSVIPENNNLYSSDNIEVQTVLKLNKEELVNYHVGLNSNAQDYYMKDYWITDKGKEYVDKNSSKQKISDIAIGALFGALFSLLVWLIENYLFKK